MPQLVGADGKPVNDMQGRLQNMIANLRMAKRDLLRAKFEAAQTFTGNESHWANVDHFDPHTVASLPVRRALRARSRYEVIENNPYLKGTVLTIVSDFVGSGPTLQVTDARIPEARRRRIEEQFSAWAKAVKLRQKLWRMRMAKIVDGETFALPYANRSPNRPYHPVLLDFHIIECDRVSSQAPLAAPPRDGIGEVDGVRYDSYENPLQYHILNTHPGGGHHYLPTTPSPYAGKWVDAKYVIHWFRQDRGWLRGIPETTASLPLCALLRRYTLAMVRAAEVTAEMTVLLETENPASPSPWAESSQQVVDDPFDIFPIEMGMIMNLPFGYKATQLRSVPPGQEYDEFVGAILREITRPILAPYNVAAGTSKDSNMASAVVDQEIYKGGQEAERLSCEEQVLEHMLLLWWLEATRVPGHLGDNFFATDNEFSKAAPKHQWGWDRIGLDHTDPSKVAAYLKVMHDKRFITDEDIQRWYFNRDRGAWEQQILRDEAFRLKLRPVDPAEREMADTMREKASSPPKRQNGHSTQQVSN